jgi:hypothetical protein
MKRAVFLCLAFLAGAACAASANGVVFGGRYFYGPTDLAQDNMLFIRQGYIAGVYDTLSMLDSLIASSDQDTAAKTLVRTMLCLKSRDRSIHDLLSWAVAVWKHAPYPAHLSGAQSLALACNLERR